MFFFSQVLRYVLLDHWRTFYPSLVAPGEGQQAAGVDADGGPLNAEALGTILQVR